MANNTTTKLTIFINGKEVERSLNGMGKELKELNKEVRGLNEGDPNFRRKSQELTKLREEYNRLRGEVYGANNATNNFTAGLKGVGAGIAAAFTVDKVAQMATLLYEQIERVRELKTELSTLSGLDGSQLSNATASTFALAETYETESKEVMLAANAMSKNLKISYADALSEIKRGFQEGANASGDMLNQIKEYAPFIKEIGGETSDLVNIIKSGTVDGVFNDKAIDAVKEFSLRFREMTTSTRDGLTNLGLNVDEMQIKIAKGQMTYMDAMMQVSKEMSKLGNNSTVTGQVLADVFGGPGEDAGFEYISNLHKMNEAVTTLSRSQQEANRIKEIEFQANEKTALFFESLTGETSRFNELVQESKLALIDMASALFGISAASPADDIRDQAVSVKMLENELFRSNTTAERRNEILKELERIHPSIFDNINKETASNIELKEAIDSVSDSLLKKMVIQQEQDVLNEIANGAAEAQRELIKAENALDKIIGQIMHQENLSISPTLDLKTPLEQAEWLKRELEKKGKAGAYMIALSNPINDVRSITLETQNWANELDRASGNLDNVLKSMGKVSKFQFKTENAIHHMPTSLFNPIEKESPSNSTNADPNRAADIKREAQEAAAERKRAQAERDREAKRIAAERVREINRLHNELIKAEEGFQKKIRSAETENAQASLELMRDGIDKEIETINLNTQNKVQALVDEIKELEALQSEYLSKANEAQKLGAKDDAARFRTLADNQVQIMVEKNSTMFSTEEKGAYERLKIYSKYRGLEVQQRQKANDDFINDLKTSYNNELAEITTLEEAKKVLQEKYGVENVNQLDTITDARNEVLKEQNKKLLQEQLGALEVELQEIQNLINSDDLARGNGLQVLTDEDRDKQIENLKNLGAAISEVKVQLTNDETGDTDEINARNANARKQVLSGIDIFGFSADDWETAFDGLKKGGTEMEKFAAKIQLAEMALQAVSNAWGMMLDSQNAALDRQVSLYEQSTNDKSIALKKQLDEGFISQETYNAEIEALEEDLAARKSEIAYKQAMNSWKMQLASNISNTALAVTAALGTFPFGPQNIAMAAIVGGIGALQTGLIVANKPNRGSYAVGGPTVGLGYTDETGHEVAGTVHAKEYVIPEWLRADPVVARMEEFIEARRTGGNPILNPTNSYANGGVVSSVNPSDSNFKDLSVIATIVEQFNQNLQLNNQFLEYLITNGVELQMDMKAAQRLNNQLETTKKFINQAKKS